MAPEFTTDPLLLQLYRCSDDAIPWSRALDGLREATGARSVVLQGIEFGQRARGSSFWRANDAETDLSLYDEAISDANNPRLDASRSAVPSGRLIGDRELFKSPEDARHARRLQGLLAEIGYGDFLGAMMPLGGGRFVALSLHRDRADRGGYSARDKRRMESLLPHIAQAVRLHQSIVAGRDSEHALRACLDRWQCGLVVCDVDGRVQWMNQPARERIAAGGLLHLRDGVLTTPGGKDRALRMALAGQAEARRSASYVALEHNGQRMHLALQWLAAPASGGASVLLMIGDDAPAGDIPPAALAALFKLTDAESRLASAVVRGTTLQQYAVRRGVSVGTVRSQLKQVLAKTGSARQSDLVRTVLCSAAAHAVSFQPAAFA